MHYTSGTTGTAEGRAPPALGRRPRRVGGRRRRLPLRLFGIKPLRRQRPHLRVAAVPHRRARVRGDVAAPRATPSCSWTSGRPEAMLRADRASTASRTATWCRRSSTACSPCPTTCGQRYDVSSLRTMIHAAAPCPREIKQRMLDWWGPVIYEYYAATEGGGTLVTPGAVAGEAGHGRAAVAGRGDPHPRRRRRRRAPTGETGTVYMKLGQGDFEYFKDKGKTEANRRDGFFTVGDVGLPRRRRLPVPVRPQERHDHLGRREHLPGRDRGRAAHPPEGRRRRRVRHPPRRLGRGDQGRGRAGAGRRAGRRR